MGDCSTVQVELGIVTPLFLGGAEPRGTPELRVLSVRGALRFWFRALLGGVLGPDLARLRAAETEVFGSTKQASPLALRIQAENLRTASFSALTQGNPGIAYLLFGARGTRELPERQAFMPGQTFQLVLRSDRARSLEGGYAALWLLCRLGGLGARSRRGGGALQVVDANPSSLEGLPGLRISAQKPEDLAQEIQQGLAQLRRWAKEAFQGDLNPVFSEKPELAVVHPKLCDIFVARRTFGTWHEGLNAIGRSLQGFRNRYPGDHRLVQDAVENPGRVRGSRLSIPRAAFGLPIIFYFPSLRRSATLRGEEHERRASPLLLRLVKLANNQYALVLVRFRAQFLPNGENLLLEVGKERISAEQPAEQILEEFLGQAAQAFGGFQKIGAF